MSRGHRPPLWLRVARKALPTLVWSGAGVITAKIYRPPGYAVGARVLIGRAMTGNVSGVVPERWVLVVSGDGRDHYVNVEERVWLSREVGDSVTAADPLIDVTK